MKIKKKIGFYLTVFIALWFSYSFNVSVRMTLIMYITIAFLLFSFIFYKKNSDLEKRVTMIGSYFLIWFFSILVTNYLSEIEGLDFVFNSSLRQIVNKLNSLIPKYPVV